METLVAALTELFNAANTLSPLALLGLMIGVMYIQIFKQPSKQELETVKDNHLHELPTIAAHAASMVSALQRIEAGQTRIENRQIESFTEITLRLDHNRRSTDTSTG